ncbi:MAG: esterase/lipase family protein, partial [Phycisphaerales bacterium]
DWRRESSTQAAALDERIRALQRTVREQRGLASDAEVKVDLLCHSMGGLLGQWYLRYGAAALPDSGPMPDPTWEGARNIRMFIMVGTPSAGSTNVLPRLRNGWDLNPLFPFYRPALIGTLPAMYQLLPPDRLARIVDEQGAPLAMHDAATWERIGWGLLDPSQDEVLAWLLPEAKDAAERRAIARDHLAKCLDAAERFHEALARPSAPPPHLRRVLFAGDAIRMPSVREIRADGSIRVREFAPGDGEVTRASALADNAVAKGAAARAEPWLEFDKVVFLPYEHLEMVGQPLFVDNLLYELLERE